MQPPFLVKHHIDSLMLKPFINCTDYEHTYQLINFKIQDIKHLSEITPGVIATAERGARFHPIIGSATPNEFTASHPRAETMML